MEIDVDLSPKFRPLFEHHRYIVAVGGRAGGKSYAFAQALIILCMQSKMRVLVTREFQKNIRQSCHRLLSDLVGQMGLARHWRVLQESLVCTATGSEVTFAGLHDNTVEGLKSTEGCDLVWCEEAQVISARSWEVLLPTIRKPGSMVWVTMNPNSLLDPTYRKFVTDRHLLNDCVLIEVNWDDNKHISREALDEMLAMKASDYDRFLNVWQGQPKTHADSVVLHGKLGSFEFEPIPDLWEGPYLGLDWGFSVDPVVLTKSWVYERVLYVEYAAHADHLEVDMTAAHLDLVPGSRDNIIRADCARPEMISQMKREGFRRMIPCKKWKGCAEDGADHLRSFDQVVVHPRAQRALDELGKWQYRVDKLTGEVKAELKPGDDHVANALTYSLEPIILGHKRTIEARPDPVELDSLGRPRPRNGGAGAAYFSKNGYQL